MEILKLHTHTCCYLDSLITLSPLDVSLSLQVIRGPQLPDDVDGALAMGLAKYERVSRQDEDFDDDGDEGQEVELGTRSPNDYGEGSSSLTASSPSPVQGKYPRDHRVRGKGQNGNGQRDAVILHSLLTTVLFILMYFTLSIGLTFYQSSLLEVN